jgi:hypothetical protein
MSENIFVRQYLPDNTLIILILGKELAKSSKSAVLFVIGSFMTEKVSKLVKFDNKFLSIELILLLLTFKFFKFFKLENVSGSKTSKKLSDKSKSIRFGKDEKDVGSTQLIFNPLRLIEVELLM